MPEWGTLGIFLLAAVALVATPGPSVLYVVARGIDQGRGAGLASAVGIQMGALSMPPPRWSASPPWSRSRPRPSW